MPIPHEDIQRIKRICMHEAAHLVIAKEMKFFTHGIQLGVTAEEKHKGSIGITLWAQGVNTIADTQTYIKKRLRILYAGVIAQFTDENGNYNTGDAENEWRNAGDLDDAKIRELLWTLTNISFPETNEEISALADFNELRDSIKQETREIIVNRYSIIEAIANKLLEKIIAYNVMYEITEQEIAEIPEVEDFLDELQED